MVLSPLSVLENWRKELERFRSITRSDLNAFPGRFMSSPPPLHPLALLLLWLCCITKEIRTDVQRCSCKQAHRTSRFCSPRMRSVCSVQMKTSQNKVCSECLQVFGSSSCVSKMLHSWGGEESSESHQTSGTRFKPTHRSAPSSRLGSVYQLMISPPFAHLLNQIKEDFWILEMIFL